MTDRDLDLVEHVFTYRLLTQTQIHRLLFPGRHDSVSKRRLTALYHHGYLGRIALPLRSAYGACCAVYHMEPKSVALLERLARIDQPSRLYQDGRREELFLRHTLAVNDVRISMALATEASGLSLAWWDELELRRRGVRARLRDPQASLRVLPDAYFTVSAHGISDGFAVELDRGTVSQARMRERFRAYGEWTASGAHASALPCTSLRVLVVVDAADVGRLSRLKRWCEDERGGSLFWFAVLDDLRDAFAVTSRVWQVAGAEGQRDLVLRAAPG